MTNILSSSCPQCSKDDKLQIEARIWFDLKENGDIDLVEESLDAVRRPNDEDGAACLACGWRGRVCQLA